MWVWPSAVWMQDPIRQLAGWNHHHRPPRSDPLPLYIFISLHFLHLNIKNRFLHVYVHAGDGIDGGGGGRRRAQRGDTPLMGEWRAWKWRAELTECLSITPHSLGYRWSLIFPDRRISACLYMTAWARQFACTTDNKRACACQNRWRCVTVSTQCCLLWLDPRPRAMSPFIIRERGRRGEEIIQPSFLPPSGAASLE